MKRIFHNGFTLTEILISVGVIILLSIIVLSGFVKFKHTQSIDKDTELVVEVLRQARSQTLSSQNASVYGVHFNATSIVLFTGSPYSAGAGTNQTFNLNSADTILTISLYGGGSDVIFDRLTGETSQDGSIILSSALASTTRTVTIYKTGVTESH